LKLVLLPGMDGTGDLFSPLIRELSELDCLVIPLPNEGSQTYRSITNIVREKLPEEDFILVAESFSGPIGATLAKEGGANLKGVIFIATFLSSPNKLLLSIAKFLPLKLLSKLPFSRFFHRALFLGSSASNELVDLVQSTVNSLPSVLIKSRLSAMNSLSYCSEGIEFPVAYIHAASDRLVPSGKAHEFRAIFNKIIIQTIEGPHFILQAKPAECAVVISELAPILTNKNR
jgi:pimeloyl-ACP methyl ester carboxylesterase